MKVAIGVGVVVIVVTMVAGEIVPGFTDQEFNDHLKYGECHSRVNLGLICSGNNFLRWKKIS